MAALSPAILFRNSVEQLRAIDLTSDAEYKFIIDSVNDTLPIRSITGRLLPNPNSPIHGNGAVQIRIDVTGTYPFDPPNVYCLTKVFHPNVADNDIICVEVLRDDDFFSDGTSLVNLIKYLTDVLDTPQLDYPMNADAAYLCYANNPEYIERARQTFASNPASRN